METRDEKNSASGHKQSDFAGTNPDRYGSPKPAEAQDNPIADQEAQNVTDGERGLSEEEAEHARNKANQRTQQQGGNT
jgi:hypothetical protein